MRRHLAVLSFAGAWLCLGAESGAQPSPPSLPSPPSMGQVFGENPPTRTTFTCQDVPSTSRRKLSCDFNVISIVPPTTQAEVNKDVAEQEAELRKQLASDATVVWRDCLKLNDPKEKLALDNAMQPGASDIKAIASAVTKACATRDSALLVQALRLGEMRRTQTCRVSFVTTFTDTFEVQDANNWIATDAPEGRCHVSSTTTLWRANGRGQEGELNYPASLRSDHDDPERPITISRNA